MLAVDVSPWLRPDAVTSPDRLFCHVYGRSGRSSDQLVPGWPYSFVAALETGRTSWTALLDAVRLGPADDAAEITATQLREVVTRIIDTGHWKTGDPDILIVTDAGYDAPRLAYLLADLPVELVSRLRSDRVLARDAGPAPSTPKGAAPACTAPPSPWPSPTPGTPPRAPPSPTPPATAKRPPRRHGTASTPASPAVMPGSLSSTNSPSCTAP